MNRSAPRSLLGFAIVASGILAACGDDAAPPAGEAPVAVLVAPTTAEAGVAIAVDARNSTDADGYLVEFVFDWGDGSPIERSADGEAVHTYEFGGRYTLVVAVVDDRGNKATAEVVVEVDGEPAPDDGSSEPTEPDDDSGEPTEPDDGSGDTTNPDEGSAEAGSGEGQSGGVPTPDP